MRHIVNEIEAREAEAGGESSAASATEIDESYNKDYQAELIACDERFDAQQVTAFAERLLELRNIQKYEVPFCEDDERGDLQVVYREIENYIARIEQKYMEVTVKVRERNAGEKRALDAIVGDTAGGGDATSRAL